MVKIHEFIAKLKEKVPTQDEIFKYRWLRPFEQYLNKKYFWSMSKQNIAMAVAIGMFCGLMPGPTQVVSAFLVAYLFRVNFSVAMVTTLYTNPFTYIPLYYVAYRIGERIVNGEHINQKISLMKMIDWNFEQFMLWLNHNLIYLLVGVPILGLFLALLGYLAVIFFWDINKATKEKIKDIHKSHDQKKQLKQEQEKKPS